MSQAKRARFGCHGTSVKLSRSGMAAMSGSEGAWPISPAANPANPAPSATSDSRVRAGTSLALGRPYMSTNCAKKNSTPRPFAIFWISSSLGSAATAMSSSSSWRPGCITQHRAGSRADSSTPGCRSCVRRHRVERGPEANELDGDLDHEPVVLAEVDAREILNPAQPLSERVRVHVERLRRGADVASAGKKLLQRSEERRAALAIVGCEHPDRVDGRVVRRRVERDSEQVLVRAELVVA